MGNKATRLLIQGRKLVANGRSEMTFDDWMFEYAESGGQFEEEVQEKRLRELAFQVVVKDEERKRKAKNVIPE